MWNETEGVNLNWIIFGFVFFWRGNMTIHICIRKMQLWSNYFIFNLAFVSCRIYRINIIFMSSVVPFYHFMRSILQWKRASLTSNRFFRISDLPQSGFPERCLGTWRLKAPTIGFVRFGWAFIRIKTHGYVWSFDE